VLSAVLLATQTFIYAQNTVTPTPQGTAQSSTVSSSNTIVEREENRLRSGSIEDRIDAVLRLGALARADASRAAAAGLRDESPRVRATTTKALRALPPAEAAGLLLPLLRDRDEFVRQETAYALGENGAAAEGVVTGLLAALANDKGAGVRGAAAVALGRIGDRQAVPALIESISQQRRAGGVLNRIRRRRTAENEFVRRSVVRSLGLLGDRQAVPALIAVLEDGKAEMDVRREAARSLGLLGDERAIPSLRGIEGTSDALLSRIAFESLVKLNAASPTSPVPPSR
jgi:HEAT repeat protein